MAGRGHGDAHPRPRSSAACSTTRSSSGWASSAARRATATATSRNAWSTVWAGGGINTGLVVGKTSDGGKNPGATVAERPITAPDYIATLCLALGIDIRQEFHAPGNRPMPLVDHAAQPIRELLR